MVLRRGSWEGMEDAGLVAVEVEQQVAEYSALARPCYIVQSRLSVAREVGCGTRTVSQVRLSARAAWPRACEQADVL